MNNTSLLTPRVIAQLIVFVVLLPLLPILISGRWDWTEAWLYAIVAILSFVISRTLAARRNPDLIRERAHSMEREDMASWDKALAPLIGLSGLLVMVVAGFDARFGWSAPVHPALRAGGFLVFVLGQILGTYALLENRYFSGVVRIQTDRGHQVISSGPYRWVRHPGYVAGLLIYLGTPLYLSTLWAFVPAALITIVLIVRTRLEDRMLQDQLAGYRDYAGRVRSRLMPHVW
ncbi:MAG: isoprenylcysteine carboxylmethyltransferase family protein [Chloroflexi bacterium]|nr:isoprenylcysteine carboxylmethyltransferase family protein [Chloroflexota bacterium]